jgi:anhydro-N-acetylmuramic acid kinase
VGLISGTSMDGIDAALVALEGSPESPRARLRAFQSVPYPPALRKALLSLAGGNPTSVEETSRLNFVLGSLFADAALAACRQGRISPRRLAVIGSHGQTVFHQGPVPQSRERRLSLHPPSTLQIGEAAIIAERTGVPVVADFRPADMAAGGQGAPLVPLIDYLLFRNEKAGVVALNIGGIANVTLIPAGGAPEDVVGFDTGPGNMVIDGLARHFSRGRKAYDSQGRWARQGKLNESILARILSLPFFCRRPPKSAGREQFGGKFLQRYFLARKEAPPEDLLRTATELTARSIAQSLEHFACRNSRGRMVVSGGGAHNRFLMERIASLLPEFEITLSDSYGAPVDAKEAMAFALLADRTLHGLPGNLPAVTGARHPAVLGKLARP